MAKFMKCEVPKCSLEEQKDSDKLVEDFFLAQEEGAQYDSDELDEIEQRVIMGDVNALSPAHRRMANESAASLHGRSTQPRLFSPPPYVPVVGVKQLTPDNLDDNSLDGRIFKLERRLKRNLPNDIRRMLSNQLKNLVDERDHPEEFKSPGAKKSALNTGGARRKVGAVSFGDALPENDNLEDDEVPADVKKKTKKINRAAPVIQHPHTMHRFDLDKKVPLRYNMMQDWKAELDRRIREQQEIDAKALKSEDNGWLGGDSKVLEALKVIGGELEPLGKTVTKRFSDAFSNLNLTSMLGPQNTEPHRPSSPIPDGALPRQTFSRRLG